MNNNIEKKYISHRDVRTGLFADAMHCYNIFTMTTATTT